MIIKKYGAIDIGSNAVRLLITMVTDDPEDSDLPRFRKLSLVRVPVRLGEDVFLKGKILNKKAGHLKETMQAFSFLLKANEIDRYMACATSAMRSATNGPDLIKEIKEVSGINIDIIDGETEAKFIASTDLHEYIDPVKNYLYVDVGGGSTEYSLLINGEKIESRSFPVGTVRLLHNIVDPQLWIDIEKWVKKVTQPYSDVNLLGSGGNINTIFKASGKKTGKPLSKDYLKKYDKLIKEMTYEERIVKLNMKEDRADVIIPALEIFINSMNWARSRRIYVPKIGLADGIVKTMYSEDMEEIMKS